MPAPDPVARGDFPKLSPLVKPQSIPAPQRTWDEAEWLRIQRGHASRDMDDKWHGFVEGQVLFLHRSWTGYAIYEATFERSGEAWKIVSATVEGESSHYRRQDDAHETNQLARIIELVLLREGDH